MKSFLRRAAAFFLAAAVLTSLSAAALASQALGTSLYSYTLDICDQTTLTKDVMWSASKSDLRTENYVTYTPSASVTPKVSYGSSVLAKQTVSSMAKSLETGGDRVLSGINGDYYVMATGDPLGLVVTDGVLRSSASYLNALGFRSDGTAIIGKPDLTLRADFKGYSLKINDINKIRTANGYYLFTDDFGTTTKNTQAGLDVILTPVTESPGETVTGASGTSLTSSLELGIGKIVSCRVEQVIEATGATEIPEGKFILSISNQAGEWLQEVARTLEPGDELDVEIFSEDTRWNDVDSAVGAMYWILSDGKVTDGLDTSSSAPRTAVGIKADGSVIFYTIDGRQSGVSIGATVKMVAQRLLELGCTEAVLLDGGGSTTLVSTYPDYTASSLINSPSEGTQRSVSNAIFLVSNLDPTGTPGSLYVTPKSLTLLAGASTQCVAKAMDTGWYPLSALPGETTWTASGGSVSDSGVFTAPAQGGTYTVTAESGGVTGSTKLTVYDTPDTITVTNGSTGKAVTSLSLTPGQTVDLNAAASYRTVGLTCSDTCFTWTCDSTIGTIASDGKFTAGNTTASGKITVSAGSKSVTLSVSVSAPKATSLLADFEGSDTLFTSDQAAFSLTGDQVQYGRQSLKASYTLSNGSALLSTDQPIRDGQIYLALWVYGDGSGNTLSARFATETGHPLAQTLTTLNFTGWKRFVTTAPTGSVSFTGLGLSGSTEKGTLYVDQVTLSNQTAADTTAPTVKLTVSGSSVKATLSDDSQGSLSADRITLTVDGTEVPFSYSNGTLTATLSNLGTSLHQVTVTAADASGNLGRASQTVGGTNEANPFADMTGHWAASYTTRLYALGILTGVDQGGETYFYPNRSITRGDFALMTARWLGLDLTAYDSVQLPYADVSAIPSWDLAAVKALYSLGLMQGSSDSDGKLRANAKATITRAEAMTILGRTQEKGYPEASLTSFSDASTVPSWAKTYVSSLVGQGVVSGTNGALRPNASVSRAEVAKMLLSMW